MQESLILFFLLSAVVVVFASAGKETYNYDDEDQYQEETVITEKTSNRIATVVNHKTFPPFAALELLDISQRFSLLYSSKDLVQYIIFALCCFGYRFRRSFIVLLLTTQDLIDPCSYFRSYFIIANKVFNHAH
jgi:hypothetical protein